MTIHIHKMVDREIWWFQKYHFFAPSLSTICFREKIFFEILVSEYSE